MGFKYSAFPYTFYVYLYIMTFQLGISPCVPVIYFLLFLSFLCNAGGKVHKIICALVLVLLLPPPFSILFCGRWLVLWARLDRILNSAVLRLGRQLCGPDSVIENSESTVASASGGMWLHCFL